MICMMCRQHATFTQTVFQGASPVNIQLCPQCAAQVQAEHHRDVIKGAPSKEAKREAVAEFLKAVGK